MGSLDAWGALAASLLVAYCIFFNLLLLALAGGLWFGARLLRPKSASGLRLASEKLDQGAALVRRGESLLVSPFIRTRARLEGLRTVRTRLLGPGEDRF